MKRKSIKFRWPYFFGQHIHSKDSPVPMPELIKTVSEWEEAKSVIEDILRWADDGGKMFDLENRTTRSSLNAAQERRNKR